MLDSLRSGSWLTAERLRVYPLIFIVFYAIALGWTVCNWDGKLDATGQPLGADYSEVYAAGTFVLEGKPALPYDNGAHAARQRDLFGPTAPFYAWGYPPYFLGLAALFAIFPYVLALVLWQASTFPLYAGAVRAALPLPWRQILPAAAGFPAVFVNLGHGHNGFLTAGLLGLGLVLLERRPLLAGMLFGCLAYKPQYGLLLPIALLAGFHWRALLAAAATAALLTLATLAAFGTETWQGFFASIPFSREIVVEQGNTGWYKLQTVFAAVRMLGGSVSMAYGFQGVSTLACALAIGWLWLRRADWRLRSAALMTATLLSTPYALDYDMMVLGPALAMTIAYLLEKGFGDWEKTLLASVWLMPLVARTFAKATYLPLGLIMTLILFALILRRGIVDLRRSAPASPRPAAA